MPSVRTKLKLDTRIVYDADSSRGRASIYGVGALTTTYVIGALGKALGRAVENAWRKWLLLCRLRHSVN